MAYPDNPAFIDFVDERTESAEIEEEEHSTTVGEYTYSLNEVPDTEFSISCTGDVNGSYTVSFTNAAPGSGCVYVNPLNGNVLHCATDAPDDLTWSYWGRGTANNKRMLEQYREPIEDVHKVARQFWVGATSPASQGVNVAKGNGEIAGKLVEYSGGTQDFSAMTFDNPGYYKAIRLALDSSGSVTYSEGEEAPSRALCDDPPSIPESKTLAIVFLHDAQNIADDDVVNTLIEVSYHSGDPDSGGSGDVAKYQYASGVVSGDAVCLTSPNTVNKADADDDVRVPAIGFIEEILDETYCTVRSSGVFEFSSKATSYDSLTFGQQVYLSTAAGHITQTQNETPDEWDQPLGVALSSSKIQITVGAATRNKAGGGGNEPGPEGGKYSYDAGVAEAEFVYLKTDVKTVDEAKANSGSTMRSIGIVDCVIDEDWCLVKNNYWWFTGEHQGKTPGNLTPGSAGDKFYISVTTEGEVQATESLNSEHYIQHACTQIDSGTVFLICCGPASKPQPDNPEDGYDTDCASDVSRGDSVYLDTNGVARKTDATNDAKKDAIGIVKAVNTANNRCSIVRPPNVYDPDSNYTGGEYFLDPNTAGGWDLNSNILFCPGHWKVRIGWGRGTSLGGLLVDIHSYGKLGDSGDDVGGDDDPTTGRLIGFFRAVLNIPVNTWVQDNPTPGSGYVETATYDNANQMRGVVLSSEHDSGPDEYIIAVLVRGLHGSGYVANQPYYVGSTPGALVPGITLGKYKKCGGAGRETGQVFVDCAPSEYIDPDGGDPVPVHNYAEQLNPAPVANPYDKIRDNDGSTAAISSDYNSLANDGREWLVELPVVIESVDFSARSTGAGVGAYLELDLCRSSDGASVLSTKAKLVTTGVGNRGDTLPQSGHSTGHVRAVIDTTKMPIDPGETLYWKYTRCGVYTTAPYGIGVITNKYGMKG